MAKNKPYQLLGNLRPEEYKALKADIEKRGVLVPVEVDENGVTLDGHNRVEIAEALDRPFKTIVRRFKTEQEKREHVIKLNLARRHLDPLRWGQAFRLLLEVRGVKRGRGKGDPHAKESKTATVAVLAEETGVSERTARHRVAQADAYDALPAKQRKAVDDGKVTLAETTKANKQAKQKKEYDEKVEQAKKAPPLSKGEPCSVVLADPPWEYDYSKSDSRRIENQYPPMPLKRICKLSTSLDKRLTKDAILFLWATSPKLVEAVRVMGAWGFHYRTCAVWDKEKIGMGYWFRQQHELLLVGVRGSMSAPPQQARRSSVFRSARGKHSAKPVIVYEYIEAAYPDLPKLEMFLRGKPRKGWLGWGAECE